MPSLEEFYTPIEGQAISNAPPLSGVRPIGNTATEIDRKYKTSNSRRKKRMGLQFINPQRSYSIDAYDWAEQHYAQAYVREWEPHSIAMDEDIMLWMNADGLSCDERRLLIKNLGLFSAVHTLVANNLVLAIYQHISCHECRQYMLRQAFEEALHIQACQYVIDRLDLEHDEEFHASHNVPAYIRKAEWIQPLTRHLRAPCFESNMALDSQKLVKELAAFYIIFKGVFFYTRFIQMLAMKQSNKMVGTSRQFKQILQDRCAHVAFGVDVINQIKLDSPALWQPAFKKELAEMIHRAVMMEIGALHNTSLQKSFEMDVNKLAEHLKLKVNQYCVQIGLPERYRQVRNQLSWMI